MSYGSGAYGELPYGGLPEDAEPIDRVFDADQVVLAQLPPHTSFDGRGYESYRWSDEDAPAPVAGLNIPTTQYLRAQHPPLWALEGRAFESPGFPEVLEYTIDYLSVLVVNPEPPPLALLHGAVWEEGSKPLPYTRYDQVYEQSYRVADDSYDVYELYVGEGSAPDFDDSAQPVSSAATLAGLSYSPTPPGTGDTLDLYIVVRKRNKYNLHSFNVLSYVLTIDSGGAEVTPDPSAPIDVVVYEGSDNTEVLVVAKYVNTDDGANAADKWEVYISNGVDPVPGTDAPVYEADMEFFGEEAGLTTTIELDSSIVAGDTIHVIVTALRSSDDARGNSAAVQYTISSALEIVESELFGGDVYIKRGVDSSDELDLTTLVANGLVNWFDMSDDDYLTGSPDITQIDDKIGSVALTRSSGGGAHDASRDSINGRQALYLPNRLVNFEDAAYSDITAEPLFAMGVVKFDPTPISGQLQHFFYIQYSGGTADSHIYGFARHIPSLRISWNVKPAENATESGMSDIAGNSFLVELRATAADDRGLRVNGAAEQTNTATRIDTVNAWDYLALGNFFSDTSDAPIWHGEWLIFNQIPNDSILVQLRQYMNSRWGVAVDGTLPS